MPKITFIQSDGARHDVDANEGQSIMEAAVSNAVPGIDADCGGACACATCHIFIRPGWEAKTGERSEMEASMLDFAENVGESSRLACQIQVSAAHDGLEVELPVAQH